MSKISKSIVISEFLWLLFFAVVFLKFDYTRTTLAVVNAIVWLCIVLVFSIIILQFLTRQAFTKVRGILLVLIFLIIIDYFVSYSFVFERHFFSTFDDHFVKRVYKISAVTI